jgi:hypothetical protein
MGSNPSLGKNQINPVSVRQNENYPKTFWQKFQPNKLAQNGSKKLTPNLLVSFFLLLKR